MTGLFRSLRRNRHPDQPRRSGPFDAYMALDGPDLVGGPRPRHDPKLDGDPRIVVLMPHLNLARMSGGPNTILQVTARLMGRGHRLRYVATFGPLSPDPAALMAHIEQVTGIAPGPGWVILDDAAAAGAELRLGTRDVLFATWWPTAHVANAALDAVNAHEFVYLIQDFEPGFYPWSVKYALASETYAMPMRAIVNEPLLLEHLVAERVGLFAAPDGGDRSRAFMPAVDRSVFSRRSPDSRGGSRHLVFYARPRHARNLFEIGLRALRLAAQRGAFDNADWRFSAIGSDLVELPLSERLALRPVPWMSYRDYGAFLGGADVLISLMLSPHTSYPPLEMAATGGLVITNTFGVKTRDALAAISPNIIAATSDIDGLVAAICEATDRAAAGPAETPTVGLPATWDEALEPVLGWLDEAIVEIRG
jgi:hypothetical protein